MSIINRFSQLSGKTVTRSHLLALQFDSFPEKHDGNPQAIEIYSRIEKLLTAYPDADVFELDVTKPIVTYGLGKIEAVVKGNELVYFQGKTKLATIRENGTITYHVKKITVAEKKEIRKAADMIGLACPADESMLHGIDCLENDDEFLGLGKPISPTDIYNYVTDLILNTIKTVGHLPWQKEWIGSGTNGEAKNYVSKKPYNGINFILLNFDIAYDKNKQPYLVPIKFDKPYYLTFNQIEEAKATLKAGSKAHRVIYYTMIFGYKNGDLEISTSDKGKYTSFIQSNGITPQELKEFGKKIPVVKYYNVYRADDCTGLKFASEPKPKTTSPIEQAQAIIDGYPKPPKYTFIGADAYYQPANDLVNMPKITAFTKEQFYYCTFFHEIVHSTGHSKRLDRGNDTRKRDGSIEDKKAYAFEELVAELGAVFLCSEAGILFTTVENSAKYLRGWNSRLITELENDNRFFLKASAQAQKAANWILDRNQEKDQVKDKMKKQFAAAGKAAKAKKLIVKKVAKTVIKASKTAMKKAVIVPKVSTIKLTVAQKKRYDKELASDNWKKYSKKKKFIVKSASYYPYKSKVWTTYYYIVNQKGETINKITGKVYNGKNMDLYKFAVKREAQNMADEFDFQYKNFIKKGATAAKDSIESKSKKHVTAKRGPNAGKQLKFALAKPVETLNVPVQVPVYINAAPDQQTKEIIDIIKETIPAEAIVVHQPESKPKNKLMQMQFDSLPMDNGWEKLMQEPAANMKIAIWGPPKNGKTAGALQLANYLTKFGNVLYNFADQGFNKSTQDLWISSGLANNPKAEPSDISNSLDLEKEIRTGNHKFVFIDMISDYIRTEKITPEGFKERFIKQFPNVSFILIFEVTKGGNFKGDQGWTHLVDAIMTVEDFLMENRGRYGSGEFVVWEEGFSRYNPKRYAEWVENNTQEIIPEILISGEIERI